VRFIALFGKVAMNYMEAWMLLNINKDYILVLLFVKYVSDKYAGKEYTTIILDVALQICRLLKEVPTSGNN